MEYITKIGYQLDVARGVKSCMVLAEKFFQAKRVAEVVGMPEKRLGKFVESPGYNIRPSLREKAGQGAPRLYSLFDLLSIALAWWLFQAGFRSQVIGRVIRTPGVSKWLRESESWAVQKGSGRFLIVQREMSPTEPPKQDVRLVDFGELVEAIRGAERDGFQVLPIGSLLSDLWGQLRKTQGDGD
jgi:hypothetical protein